MTQASKIPYNERKSVVRDSCKLLKGEAQLCIRTDLFPLSVEVYVADGLFSKRVWGAGSEESARKWCIDQKLEVVSVI